MEIIAPLSLSARMSFHLSNPEYSYTGLCCSLDHIATRSHSGDLRIHAQNDYDGVFRCSYWRLVCGELSTAHRGALGSRYLLSRSAIAVFRRGQCVSGFSELYRAVQSVRCRLEGINQYPLKP